MATGREQSGLGRGGLKREAEQVLEVGQAVVAAEAEIVAKELLEQSEGHRLGDDREIDAGHARAEREPAEGERQEPGNQHHHRHRVRKPIESPPGDRQLLPVQEHHEVRQDRVGVDAARPDLPHEIHAHRIAAEREERAMAERQNAAIAPDQIERDGEDRVTKIFAEQLHQIRRQVEGRIGRHAERQHRHQDRRDDKDRDEDDPELVEAGAHASTARPRRAKSPLGRL